MSDGLCECGCGGLAPIAPRNHRARGLVRGKPRRFIHGHNGSARKTVRYLEEDRGYETPCWVWQMSTGSGGYGQHFNGERLMAAHRFYYELHVGPIPLGLDLDHLCRVRACVNPTHLEPVTRGENLRRGYASRRAELEATA